MSLVVIGIDEAGYGPMLGPLSVGMSAFRIADPPASPPADASGPDLWNLLRAAVCRKPGDRRRRIAVADSKRLKRGSFRDGPEVLAPLERALLSFLRVTGFEATGDDGLFARLGAECGGCAWYKGVPTHLPLTATPESLGVDANTLSAAMARAGVELLDVRCLAVGEAAFNRIVRERGSKGECTVSAIGRHWRDAVTRWAGAGTSVRIVCDRLGGRTRYRDVITRELTELEVGFTIRTVEEGAERSRYEVDFGGSAVELMFMPEAESAHLPVAMASIAAKFVRELAMMRFNRYWCALVPELRPTAGYYADARRWLDDMGPRLTAADREAMVRLA
jgi:ribonuclease HII